MITKVRNLKTALIRNVSILNRYTYTFSRYSRSLSTRTGVYLYAAYPVSIPFEKLDWKSENEAMRKYRGLVSKTYLSGDNNTIGGFYEFKNREDAEEYVKKHLEPWGDKFKVKGTFKIFCKEKTKVASKAMDSPYCK